MNQESEKSEEAGRRDRQVRAGTDQSGDGSGRRGCGIGIGMGSGSMREFCGKYGKKILAAVFWIALWQLAACRVGNRILLAGPAETLAALGQRIFQESFWLAVGSSLLRIGAGFTAGLLSGLLLAASASRLALLKELLAPVIALLKAIPVASFVVLFLIWWRSGVLAVAVSFCIVLPNIYVNTLEGISRVDRRLLEMADVLEIPAWNRFFYIYRPALKPYLDNAVRISVGMSWKSGVAAEVIGIPALSVGEQLYLSKIYLDTAGVLAWTAVTILASVLCERLALALWNLFQRWEPGCRAAGRRGLTTRGTESETGCSGGRILLGTAAERTGGRPTAREIEHETGCSDGRTVLELAHVSKSYRGRAVLQDVAGQYERGQIYYFRTPSGSGKTTLFRLIAGLEEPDETTPQAQISRHGSRMTMVFQEDRLCEEYSPLVNVDMVTGDRERARKHLRRLLDEADLQRPCRELSGGMKRRVALARAMAAGGDVMLLDEPFSGLDAESRRRMERYIDDQRQDSALLVATHIGEFISF